MYRSRSFLIILLIPLGFLAGSCGSADDQAALPGPDDIVNVDEAPVFVDMQPTVYPEEARQREVQGTVVVRALVGKDGKIVDCFVVETVDPLLNEAAAAAAKTAVFKPARSQNKRVAVWVQVPVRFSLKSEGSSVGTPGMGKV